MRPSKEELDALTGSTKSGQSSTTSAAAKRGRGGTGTEGVASQRGNKRKKDSASTSSSRNAPKTSARRKRARISNSEDLEDQNEEELAAAANSGVDPNDFDYAPPQAHPEDEEVIVVNTIEQKPRIGVENPQENHSSDEQDDVVVIFKKPTTSLKELLILLRGSLMAIRSPSLHGICAKFDTKIQELATGNRQMPLENLHVPLDSCLLLLLKNAALQCEEEATSLRDFLLRFQATTCHIIHPTMASFHQKLKTKISELSARDERIPITIIERAMDNTLLLLAP